MSIVSKVFIGLVMVAAIAFLVLAGAELKLQKSHREVVNQLEASIKQQTDNNKRLFEGDPGVHDLELRLYEVTTGRGRIWVDCQPAGVEADAATGAVKVNLAVGKPTPSQLIADMTLFLFTTAAADAPAKYLGQFKVATVADPNVALSPVDKLSAAEMERLRGSAGPWIAYEKMPGDSHEVLAGVPEDKVKSMLSGGTADEFVRDGKPSQPGDAPQRVVDGKYQRALRDYVLLFTEYLRQRAIRVDELAAAKSEWESIEKALADAKKQVAFHEQQIADLRHDLAQLERESEAVRDRLAALRSQFGDSQQAIAKLLDGNRQLAKQLAAQQLEALRQADELTGTGAAGR